MFFRRNLVHVVSVICLLEMLCRACFFEYRLQFRQLIKTRRNQNDDDVLVVVHFMEQVMSNCGFRNQSATPGDTRPV